ncbi:MAG: hypothetical protein F9K44_14270 [Hyphomicrobiaceae bacterium]|nr:MAG: hypothetical protein F9K44_14270 [Hyphomicrobiaceae bacterium]
MLIDLWAAVGDRLPEGQRSRLGEIYAGPIKATQAGAWAQTRREQGQDAVNLTIEISADQIDINVVGGTKPQAAQLEAWLRRRGAGEFWRASPDLELVFYRRSAHKKGARPVWQGARWELIRAYPASALARKGFSSLRIDHERDLDGGRTEHLAYHLSKKWARDLEVVPLLVEL